ncbi:hypothetical protein D3C76_1861430 [compost metagenome]
MTCKLHVGLSFAAVYEADMLEEKKAEVLYAEQDVVLPFRPFEVKTIRLQRNEGE